MEENNLSSFKKVFILSPHTDDGELGAGGLICRLIESGCDVYYFAFSAAEESVPDGYPKNILRTEVLEATKRLGIPKEQVFIYNYAVRKLNYHRQEILEDLISKKKEINPSLVLLPSSNDIHQDHSTIASEGIRAFKGSTILGYELIWNNLTFNNTLFVNLKKEHINNKIYALKAYNSQASRIYFTDDFIFSLARTRGVQVGKEYAESFEVIRWII